MSYCKHVVGIAISLTTVACNSVVVHTPPDGPASDAAAEVDAMQPDADTRPCDPTAPFGPLQPVAGLNTADEDEFVTLSPDELTVYLANNTAAPGTANHGLYVASRASVGVGFGTPVALTQLNTVDDDRSPSVTADGLSLFFHSSRTGFYEIYVSTRASTAASFGDPVALGAGVNTAATETSPMVTADGQTLYFDRDSGSGTRLWRSILGPTGFGTATPVTELNTDSAHSAVLSGDGLTLFFASGRTGGAGLIDIWVATRSTTADVFGDIHNVTELNTPLQEFPDWLSPDGCRLYLSAQRPDDLAKFDVFVAERP